jgi:hypothetical protein
MAGRAARLLAGTVLAIGPIVSAPAVRAESPPLSSVKPDSYPDMPAGIRYGNLLYHASVASGFAWDSNIFSSRENVIGDRITFIQPGLTISTLDPNRKFTVEVLIGFVALDPWTAYYRVLIWENAFIDLASSPLFGAALDAWTRPPWMTASVDSFWLVTALSAGLPAVAMLAAMILIMIKRVHARSAAGESRQRWAARFGWTVAVLALCLQAFTVHYWGSMNSFFFFILGMGAWMTDGTGDPGQSARNPADTFRARLLFPQRGVVLRRAPPDARG